MAKAKRLSACLQELGALKRETWFDKLPQDVQQELLEVRQDYYAGKYSGLSIRRMYDYLADKERGKLRVTTGRNGFQAWLAEGRRGKAE